VHATIDGAISKIVVSQHRHGAFAASAAPFAAAMGGDAEAGSDHADESFDYGRVG
jgi:hypothetical protein